MAGQGAKKFPAFSKLSSDDVNGYLSSQVIMRFATTTARDAAFGGTGEFTLAEGMTCYIDADNSLYIYDGSNWVKTVSASQPTGLQLITAQSFTSVGTSGLLFSDVFSSEFRNYRAIINIDTSSQNLGLFGRFGSIATPYNYATLGLTAGNAVDNVSQAGGSAFLIGYIRSGTNFHNFQMDIFNPNENKTTTATYSGYSDNAANNSSGHRTGSCLLNDATPVTGFTLLTSAGTVNGSIRIYGYRD